MDAHWVTCGLVTRDDSSAERRTEHDEPLLLGGQAPSPDPNARGRAGVVELPKAEAHARAGGAHPLLSLRRSSGGNRSIGWGGDRRRRLLDPASASSFAATTPSTSP